MRITLIHALRHSMDPIERSFARHWPAASLRHLLDDGLSGDLARAGALTDEMTNRFLELTRYALATGASGVLFTCSAFGPCIEACAAAHPDVPILKPNEAMVEVAAGCDGQVGLLATFAPTLATMPSEFPPEVALRPKLIPGALDALDRGDVAEHDRLAVEAAVDLQDCPVLALAQFSLARAAPAIERRTGKVVLTTPDCAVRKLRAMAA